MQDNRKYKAFMSYSHADKAWATSLHLRLETFRTPKKLIGQPGRFGPVSERLRPVFRDREELSTGSALGPELQTALTNAEFLIVLCSPKSANSQWVNEEIRFFRKTHGDARILAAIVDGDPGAPVGEGRDGCFPPALIEPPEGSDEPREPIAADFREVGDGKRLGFQKLASGMLGVGLDALVQRMAARRQRRMAQIAAGMAFLSVILTGLTIYAFFQRGEAIEQRAIAEKERDTATASLDFLVSIFEIANPATENPKTITALTILERGRNKLDSELAGRPEVQAKLLGAMGRVYFNLGEIDDADVILSDAIENREIAVEDEIAANLVLADIRYRQNDGPSAYKVLEDARQIIATSSWSGHDRERSIFLGEAFITEAYVAAYIDFDKERAVTLMDKARVEYESSGADVRRELADIYSAQGTLFADMGLPDRAMTPLNAALEGYSELYPENHVLIGRALHNLALADFQAARFSAAAENSQRAIEILENVLEDSHPNIGMGYMLFGRINNGLGKFEESQAALLNAVDSFRAAFGSDHYLNAVALIYLGKFQAENGRTEDSFASLDEADRIYQILYPPDHANHGDLLVYRAIALKADGRRADARESCAKGLEIMEKSAAGDAAWLAENRSICEKIG